MAKQELEEVFEEDEVPAPKVKRKVAAKAAAAAAPIKGIKKRAAVVEEDEDEESEDEAQPRPKRGLKEVNLFQLLRESFSTQKGLSIEDAVELIREATEGKKARNGKPYPEALMVGRVRKFLAGAKLRDEVEVASEKNGTTKYRYTGEVNVARGRDRQTQEEKAANPPKKAAKPVVKSKVKAKPVVIEDEDESDETEE